jgi:ABC-2 type transport system permease protein
MIWTVCKISILRLWNNKQEFMLAFVVPILFFSIFALIFSRGVGQTVSQVRVSFIDDDQSPESLAVIRDACQHPEIVPVTGIGRTSKAWPIETLSRLLISRRNVEVVVHIPAGFTTQDPDAPTLSIELLNEGGNPIGYRLVQASLAESIAMQLSAASLATVQGTRPLAPSADAPPIVTASFEQASSTKPDSETQANPEPAVFKSVNAFASNKHQPKVAMAAAGIAVMFLLFSANGAGASLLEEREAGTMGRLLSSRLTLTQLLAGKWLYITGLGCTQLFVMFAWGQMVFQVDMLGHFAGFFAMTIMTAGACASFALFLAAVCKTRQQLHGVSVILVLTMSAIGGSMVPRYVMSDSMRALGKFTFNGWALDGFQKIFWYDLPLDAIRLELIVLFAITLLLGIAARLLARHWSVA